MATNSFALVTRIPIRVRASLLAALVGVGTLSHAGAQTTNGAVSSVAVPLPAGAAKVPFAVGEKLDYEVRLSSLKVGSGTMEVQGIEDVRGRPSYHAVFKYSGSMAFAKVNDSHETWFDVETLASRRFYQNIDNPGYDRISRFEIFPERGLFKENDKPEQPTPQNPLDLASFLYFIRTLPLEVGKTYEFSRYFKAEANPVKITVLRREKVKVPAGEFNAFVVRPVIKTKGLFSEGGKAEVWITDDSRRMMVQLKSKLSIGSINLYLKSQNAGAAK